MTPRIRLIPGIGRTRFRHDHAAERHGDAIVIGEGTYEPDWSGWLLIAEVTVEDAVALTLNFDPDKRTDWEKTASAAQRAEFNRRLYWLNKWPLRIEFSREPSTGCVDAEGFGPIMYVSIRKLYLHEVVHYAKKAGWKLPEPLINLIEAKRGDQEKASKTKIPSEDKKVASREPVVQPKGISKKAWARYSRALDFDPGFPLEAGSISKAARYIAQQANENIAGVRRDLHRVLNALRVRSKVEVNKIS